MHREIKLCANKSNHYNPWIISYRTRKGQKAEADNIVNSVLDVKYRKNLHLFLNDIEEVSEAYPIIIVLILDFELIFLPGNPHIHRA